MVVVTEQGWVKRQQRVKDVASTRVREGDRVLAVLAGLDQEHRRVLQQPRRLLRHPHRRHPGDHRVRRRPLQTLFKMADGERIVGAMGFDPRFLEVPPADEKSPRSRRSRYAVAVTRGGLALRFSLRAPSRSVDAHGPQVHAAQGRATR